MTADRRSVSEQPPCKVCEGWGAYCDDHRPPVSGEPRGSHAEMEGSQGHDFWLPPVSGEPRKEERP